MNEKELKSFYYLRKEIEDIDSRIKELEETGGISGIKYKEVDVMATSLNKGIYDKLLQLINLWQERRITAIEEYLKIEGYINSIPDAEIKQIMKYRYLDLKKWEDISNLMHMDRTTIYRKISKYTSRNTMQH